MRKTMQTKVNIPAALRALTAAVIAAHAATVHADVVTDWNAKAGELIIEAKLGTPPATRVMAFVQTAVYDAVRSADKGASTEAAVAAANRAVLTKLLPAQQASIDAAYQTALAGIADSPAKAAGIALGERAAAAVFTRRAGDMPTAPEAYRPHTTPGVYVPTAAPAAPQWVNRTTWLMNNAGQFRAAPPPALTSDTWARDYNEVKDLGASSSTRRSTEQTDIARFWEYSLPSIYFGVVRSVADQPGRDPVANARLYAAIAQVLDDGLIGVLESKYHYHFWRPSTAIRNGDIDGNDATAREPSWTPLITAPLHPEYPSAHATLAGAVGTVLKAEIGNARAPILTTASPTAKGATRKWASVDAFVQEVADSRIYAGIHYRFATDAGIALGSRIGDLAVTRLLHAQD
jgi:hypothetical protein